MENLIEKQIVSFNIGTESFGIDILMVQEIIQVPNITKIPKTPEFVEGIINLRGKIIPILDLRKRFDTLNYEFTGNNRIIIVEINDKLVGLIVDSVSEVIKLKPENIDSAGTISVDLETRFVEAVAKLENRLIILLNINEILSGKEKEILNKTNF